MDDFHRTICLLWCGLSLRRSNGPQGADPFAIHLAWMETTFGHQACRLYFTLYAAELVSVVATFAGPAILRRPPNWLPSGQP